LVLLFFKIVSYKSTSPDGPTPSDIHSTEIISWHTFVVYFISQHTVFNAP